MNPNTTDQAGPESQSLGQQEAATQAQRELNLEEIEAQWQALSIEQKIKALRTSHLMQSDQVNTISKILGDLNDRIGRTQEMLQKHSHQGNEVLIPICTMPSHWGRSLTGLRHY